MLHCKAHACICACTNKKFCLNFRCFYNKFFIADYQCTKDRKWSSGHKASSRRRGEYDQGTDS